MRITPLHRLFWSDIYLVHVHSMEFLSLNSSTVFWAFTYGVCCPFINMFVFKNAPVNKIVMSLDHFPRVNCRLQEQYRLLHYALQEALGYGDTTLSKATFHSECHRHMELYNLAKPNRIADEFQVLTCRYRLCVSTL